MKASAQCVLAFFLLVPVCMTFSQTSASRYDALVIKAMDGDYDQTGGLALIRQSEADAQSGLVKGIVCHNLALLGREEFVAQTKTTLEPLLSDPLAMGYYGSVITVEGGFASKRNELGTATSLLQTGFQWIDKAVAAAPGYLPLRILRLSNGIQVSRESPYKRYDLIKADLDLLLAAVPSLDRPTRATVYLLAGDYWLALKKASAALDMYDKATQEGPETRAGKQAAHMLATLEG